jgi:dipeptidyl aminopeptidase/acylaminoacyl peptidase
VRATDIDTLVALGRPTVAPDGAFAIFATSRPELDADRYVGQLWRVELPDGAPRRLTRGVADAAPSLSPDGGLVAFLRADGRGHPQIHVIDAHGGEPVRATDAPLGVGEFAWSPDGRRFAFTARIPEPGRYGTLDGRDAASEPPRHITGIRWNANGLGYSFDRPAQVFVVDVPDPAIEPEYDSAPGVDTPGSTAAEKRSAAAAATALTEGPTSWSSPVWTADGAEIIAVPDEVEAQRRDLRSRVVAMRADGSGDRDLLGRHAGLGVNLVDVAPDGAVFALAYPVGATGTDFVAPGVALWMLGDDEPRRLTDAETIDLGEVGSVLSFLAGDVLVQDRTRGRLRLLRVGRDASVSEVLGGDVEVTSHAVGGERIAAVVATPRSFGELAVVEHRTGEGRHTFLTDFSAPLRSTGLTIPTEIEIAGSDGYPVHGWVATPQGEGPFPVLLQIHGGPYASYGVHVFDETQVLVDAGYAVVYGNPRGSAGYGRAHGRSIRGRMGTDDLADVLDLLDGAVAADPRLDGTRVGIMGGSYGGYLTAWTIAHDHRFAGAIVERGFLDPDAFAGTSDIGSFFGAEYVGTDPERVRAQSPAAVVAHVRTPTFVIHSENDLRCPLDQATRYYYALRSQGTPAELLVFPGEDHELSRAGRPRHRVERFEAILDWWSRHLPA